MVVIYTLVSVVAISLLSVVAILPLLYKKKVSNRFLLVLLSLSVGALLGGVFIHFFPEMIEHGYHLETALFILFGFLVFFFLEKLIHWHHSKKCITNPGSCAHGHAYHLAPMNLIGDGIHNFLDGLVIAGAYVASVPLGIAATISVAFHELPQEIADFGVLLYSGWSKFKALVFNFLSATTAIVGAIVGLVLAGSVEHFVEFIIPFAAGNFLYIAAVNLVPELHRKHKLVDTIVHLAAIAVGIGLMVTVSLVSHGH